MSRYLNISLAYRWSLPLFMLSYVPIFIDYGNPTLRLAAYAINFLGMFGVQFGCWLGACKYLRRTGSPALTVFGVYALGEGLGIFAGCLVGLYAVLTLDVKALPSGTDTGATSPKTGMDAGAVAGASFGMLAAAGVVAFALRRKLAK